jgi:hypothetical protein
MKTGCALGFSADAITLAHRDPAQGLLYLREDFVGIGDRPSVQHGFVEDPETLQDMAQLIKQFAGASSRGHAVRSLCQ